MVVLVAVHLSSSIVSITTWPLYSLLYLVNFILHSTHIWMCTNWALIVIKKYGFSAVGVATAVYNTLGKHRLIIALGKTLTVQPVAKKVAIVNCANVVA